MLKLLSARERGMHPPWLLPKVYQHQRYAHIELSSTKEFARAHKSGVSSIDIDRNGRYILSGGKDKNGLVTIHDLFPTSASKSEAYADAYERGVRNAPSYPIIAKVDTNPTTSSSSSRNPRESTSHSISVVQWYPHDTGLFTTSSTDKTLKIWDTNCMMMVEKFSFSKIVYTHSLAAAESHPLIAVGGGECKITLCDMESGSTTHILRSHSKPVLALSWSPISDHLLASGGQDSTVILWDIRRASGPLMTLDQHNGNGSSNTAAVVTAHNNSVNGLCFTSDGLHLVSFGSDHALRLWDAFNGKNTLINYGRIANTLVQQTVQLYCTPHTSSLEPLAIIPSGGELIMADLMTGKQIKKFCGHYGSVTCVTGSPVEQEFYSGGSDRNILSWAPPSPAASGTKRSVQRRDRALPHSQLASVYEDAWSSDED